MDFTTFDFIPGFQHPFNAIVCASSQSGKSTWINQLLVLRKIHPFPKKIIWIYSFFSKDSFDKLKHEIPQIEFVKGIPEDVAEEDYVPPDSLIIIDDMIDDINRCVLSLFVKASHHLRRSCILVLQNLYHSNPNLRTISLNSHYIVVFKQPRDMSQINCFGKQMYPGQSNSFVKAFRKATAGSYGYLFVDLRASTPDILRLRTGVLEDTPDRFERVYDIESSQMETYVLVPEAKFKELQIIKHADNAPLQTSTVEPQKPQPKPKTKKKSTKPPSARKKNLNY